MRYGQKISLQSAYFVYFFKCDKNTLDLVGLLTYCFST